MEVESRSRMAKIMELQRRLRLQRAFKKLTRPRARTPPPPPPPEPSNYIEDDDVEYTDVEMLDEVDDPDESTQLIDDSFYEAGFDRYDIVELNGDGTAGEAFKESVIIKHSLGMTMQQALEPEIKIKSEPEDVYEPPVNPMPPPVFDLIPSELIKNEHGRVHPTLAEFQDAEMIRIKQEILKSCESDVLKPKVIEKKKMVWKYPRDDKRGRDRDGVLECDICGKRFTYLRSFKQHRSDHKLQNDCIECRVCGKMLKPSAMDYHMNYKHSEERKFQVWKVLLTAFFLI